MTTVRCVVYVPDTTGDVLASGSLIWVPTIAQTGSTQSQGTAAIVPRPFTVTLDGVTVPSVTVDPTGATWCWKVTERISGGRIRYVQVPASGTIDYGAMTDVDPTTLAPAPAAEAAWTAALAVETSRAEAAEALLLPTATASATFGVVVALGNANGTDDTTALNALLATAGGKVARGVPGQSYRISAPLVLPSGATLDMTGCTVTLLANSNCNMLNNYAVTHPNRSVADAAITTGTATLTSATGAFTAADVGRTVVVTGAGGGAGPLVANITAVNTSTSVTLSRNAGTTVAAAACSIYTRDTNITVRGGTWDRGGNGGGTDNTTRHSLLLRHVDNLLIEQVEYLSTAGKYGISIGDATVVKVRDYTVNSYSDGLHVDGPASDLTVENVSGPSGDDLVAFSTDDYSQYNDTQGPLDRIRVRNVTGNTPTRAVLVSGSTNVGVSNGYNITDVVIENVAQLNGIGTSVLVDCVAWSTETVDSVTVRGGSGPVTVRHQDVKRAHVTDWTGVVTVMPWTGLPITVDNLILDNVWSENASLLEINTNSTVNNVIINTSGVGGTTTTDYIFAATGATFGRVVLNGCQRTTAAGWVSVSGGTVESITFANCDINPGGARTVWLNGGATETITFTGCKVHGTDTNFGDLVYKTAGTLARLVVANTRIDTIRGILHNGATGAVDVLVTNLDAYNFNRLVDASYPVTFLFSNIDVTTAINAPFYVDTATTLTVRGTGWNGYTANVMQRASTETIRVVAPDLPVDLSLLAKNDSDMAKNTNGTLACGVGLAVSNGTNWKNVYSGAVY